MTGREPGDSEVPLIGRERELRQLQQVLDAATKGNGSAAVVEGMAGIGKTRLLREALNLAERDGHTTFYGAAEELEQARPFGAVADALGLHPGAADPERARIGALLTGILDETSVPAVLPAGPETRYALVEAIARLVTKLASDRPVVIALDDLQWADAPTLMTLRAIARRMGSFHIALFAALRLPAPGSDLMVFAQRLVEAGATPVTLAPLDATAVHALAASVLGCEPGESLTERLALAEGNPLFVLELLSALQRDGAVQVAEGRAELAMEVALPNLEVTVLHRVNLLPRQALDVLQVASILGGSFEVADLGLILGRSAVELLPDLHNALSAGVLESSGPTRIAFRHDLVREAIYGDLAPGLRAALHLQVAWALAEAEAPPLKVATHLSLGAPPGDHRAAAWLHRAARQVSGRSPKVAADLLHRALEIVDISDPLRDDVVADLVHALLWSDQVSDAEALAQDTLMRGQLSPSAEASVYLALVNTTLVMGRAGDARRHAEAALARAEVAGVERSQILAKAATARLLVGDVDGAVSAAHAGIAAGDDAGDDDAVCAGMCALSTAVLRQARTGEALAWAMQAMERTYAGTSEAARCSSDLALAAAFMDADCFAEAQEALTAGRRRSRDHGSGWNLALYQFALGRLRFLTGDWDDALAEVQTGLGLTEDIGIRVGALEGLIPLALIALHRNELDRAERVLAAASDELMWSGRADGVELDWVRSLVLESRGNSTEALVRLSQAWKLVPGSGLVVCPAIGPDLVRMALAAGDRDQAKAVTSDVEAAAQHMGSSSARASAMWCRGLVEGEVKRVLEAVPLFDQAGRALSHAAACEAAGRMGDGVEALDPTLLEESLRQYEKLGARRDVARVESVLRRLGVRLGRQRQTRPARPASGWASLTPTETEVARLVVEGLTGPEVAKRLYVSVRTVESHVSHILSKLGVRSRSELRTAARNRPDAI